MSFETVFQSKIVIDNLLKIQRSDEILTKEALNFVSALESKFKDRRKELLNDRKSKQSLIDNGQFPDFLSETKKNLFQTNHLCM